MTETVEDRINSLQEQANETAVEVASLKRALLSMGSSQLVGGPPGPLGYIAWHNDQVKAGVIPAALTPAEQKIAALEAQLAMAKEAASPPASGVTPVPVSEATPAVVPPAPPAA